MQAIRIIFRENGIKLEYHEDDNHQAGSTTGARYCPKHFYIPIRIILIELTHYYHPHFTDGETEA